MPKFTICIILLLNVFSFVTLHANENEAIGLKNDTVYSGDDVAIFSDLHVTGNSAWNLAGTLQLSNGANIYNNSNGSVYYGNGVLLLESSLGLSINGGELSIPSLTVITPSGVDFNTNVRVVNNVVLSDGVVRIQYDTLFILSKEETALVADVGVESTSYINGALNRSIAKASSVIFPVGNADSCLTVEVENSENDGNATVIYSADTLALKACDLSTFFYGYTFNEFFTNHVWKVSPQEVGRFDLNLYHASEEYFDPAKKQYAVGVNSSKACEDWIMAGVLDYSSPTSTNVFDEYISGYQISEAGYFAILMANKSELDIVNLIRLDDGSETNFVIPNVWEFENNSLQIFSRWGTAVFEASDYDNSFDFEGSQAGTYYYVFKYTEEGSEQEVKSFVEVVK